MESLLESKALLDILVSCDKGRQGSVLKSVAIQLLEAALGGEELHDTAQTVFVHLGCGSHFLDGNGTVKRHNREVLEAQRNLPSGKVVVAAAEGSNPLKRACRQHAQVLGRLVQVVANGVILVVLRVRRGRCCEVGLLETVLLKVAHESFGLLESFTGSRKY